jgi:hypothetical protein
MRGLSDAGCHSLVIHLPHSLRLSTLEAGGQRNVCTYYGIPTSWVIARLQRMV